MTIVGIICILLGLFSSLVSSIMLLAGMANSTPHKLRVMTMLTWSVVIVGVGCAIAAVVLLWKGQSGWATLTALMPVAFDVVLFVVSLILEI